MNQVTLYGRLVADAVTRTVGTTTVTAFKVATDENYKDKNGEWQKKTQFHPCEAWAMAETKAAKMKKGTPVLISGSLEHGSYEKDGVKHYTARIKCSEVTILCYEKQPSATPSQTETPPPVREIVDVNPDDLPF